MALNERSFSSTAPWLWAGLSLVAWFVSLFVAVPLAAPVVGANPTETVRWDLAVLLGINGLLSMAAAFVIGRRIFGRGLTARAVDFVLPLIGLALAIAVELTLHEWARVHFGYYDWDFVGWTAGLSFMVVLCSLATFGVLVAPRGAVAPPLMGVGLAAMLVCLIVVSNVPGLRDGIDPESWPLAVGVGLSAMYVISCVVVGVRKATAR